MSNPFVSRPAANVGEAIAGVAVEGAAVATGTAIAAGIAMLPPVAAFVAVGGIILWIADGCSKANANP